MSAAARARVESFAIPLGAIVATLLLFGVFVSVLGKSPLDVYYEMYRGAFGTWFSMQNTLLRASPLMLTALCTALPARLGLMIIGGEGALVLGGLAAAATGVAVDGASPTVAIILMMAAGIIVGGIWIMLAGAMRVYRGVNETISSLLLTYIAIALLNHFVEGPLKDPASLNKPSTRHIQDAYMIGSMPGMDVHWGLGLGLVLCVVLYVLMYRTVFGFSASVVGGNLRAARLAGLSVARLTLITCFLGGGAAGLAGMVEVTAVHGAASASLVAGYGYAGILVAFLARQNPLAIIPVALLLGGINASGGLLQRVFSLPDATVSVLQGMLFVIILGSETLYGRFTVPAAAKKPEPEAKLAVV
ncbi:MAG TPA: ABC transporter permease [Polyangiaceae bacterium]|nr:ABC transporter permease [Polyangiaceae bacterium]